MYTFKGTSGKPGDIDGGTRGERTACDRALSKSGDLVFARSPG